MGKIKEIVIPIKIKISLWTSIKMRIAGVPRFNKRVGTSLYLKYTMSKLMKEV
jgi:hypothetical protein